MNKNKGRLIAVEHIVIANQYQLERFRIIEQQYIPKGSLWCISTVYNPHDGNSWVTKAVRYTVVPNPSTRGTPPDAPDSTQRGHRFNA